MTNKIVRHLPVAFLVCLAFSTMSTVVRVQTGVPSPWVSVDIGNPSPAGSAASDGQSFDVSAGGADIWGSSDQFRFVYQPVSGNVDVVARVDAIDLQADHWSKIGVMIRSSLNAGAAHGFALVSAGKGIAYQRRTQSGGVSINTYGENATAPRWVRLTRNGTLVTAYSSANGSQWTKIASSTIALGQVAYVGLAATSHRAGSMMRATVSQVNVMPLGLPAGQSTSDIGGPAIAGTTSFQQGAYTMTAGGADIWGTSDQFRFVYQPVAGDVDLKARVASITMANEWSKAGVMVRESLASGSRNAYTLLSAGRGYSFQWRLDASGFSDAATTGTGAAPGWVRLKRTGSLFESFTSTNGTTWTPIGSQTVPMNDSVYVGIAVTSHNASKSTTATIDNFSVTQSSAPPNQPPIVALTSPASAATYTAPGSIPLSATASDPENRLARVEFYANANRVGTDTTAPYAMTWSSVAAGTYSITAVAFDSDGGSATSPAATVTVTSANQAPTVSLTSPANGASFSAPATVSLAATASDPENRLARVEFYVGASLVATDTTSPFAATWTTSTAGTYIVKAIAYDSDGGSATSATRSITVAGPNQAPTVSLTSPANGASFSAPAAVSLAATASDPENRLARVEFYIGSSLVATDTTSPFAATWTASAAGSYAVKAIAYDSDGGVTQSSIRTITVTASATAPTQAIFQASADHATGVTSYRLDVFSNGANPSTATPVASSSLGKPTPDASGTITVDRATFFSALAPATYVATVSAVGPSGEGRSQPVTFVR